MVRNKDNFEDEIEAEYFKDIERKMFERSIESAEEYYEYLRITRGIDRDAKDKPSS